MPGGTATQGDLKTVTEKQKREAAEAFRARPARAEVIESLQDQIDILEASYTELLGPFKGRIRSAAIRHQIACLKEAIRLIGEREGYGGETDEETTVRTGRRTSIRPAPRSRSVRCLR